MNVSVDLIVPVDDGGDPHRAAAWDLIRRRLADHHPAWRIITSDAGPGTWSKGAAVADAVARSTASVLVIHDADSYVEPDNLAHAVELVAGGAYPWFVPHRAIYRLNERETARVLAGNIARRGHTIRTPYSAVPGGGITVVSRAAFDAVGGIDPRFVGWGGEDVAFGYALDTLVGAHGTGAAPLVHLWHPHPAPNLRGPPASEDLIAEYTAARGLRRRMSDLCERRPVAVPPPLERPVTFRLPQRSARTTVRIGSTSVVFTAGAYTADDPDVVDALRAHPYPTEVIR